MIGTSLPEYIFIRLSILLLYHAPLIWPALLLLLTLTLGWSSPATKLFACLTVFECTFALGMFLPHLPSLRVIAAHPPPLSREERQVLFTRCVGDSDAAELEAYLRGWFLGARSEELKRENVEEFFAWAFFDGEVAALDGGRRRELAGFLQKLEQRLGRKLPEGRGRAKSVRLTLDPVETRYRSVVFYFVIGVLDLITHVCLTHLGFRYYAQPRGEFFSVYPPRPQQLTAGRRSPVPEMGYWFRPHTARDKLPVVFLHGIGIGLFTYLRFLAQLVRAENGVGVLAIEVLPVSMRLCLPPLSKPAFVAAMEAILDHHRDEMPGKFVLVSHSYGSVLGTHLLRHPGDAIAPRIASIVLIDPVAVLLHKPNIAVNFTRRAPRRANEWMLWFFASMDPGVAATLGRWFFWRENILWREDIEHFLAGGQGPERRRDGTGRRVLCYLAARDLIVDTEAVRVYLEGSGTEVVMFPDLDHSQAFDFGAERAMMVDGLLSCCRSGGR